MGPFQPLFVLTNKVANWILVLQFEMWVSDEILPSVFCMSRSTRVGYFVMRWVTNRKHSGIPNLRTMASWPIFCYKKKGFVFQDLHHSCHSLFLFLSVITVCRNVITVVCEKPRLLDTVTGTPGMYLIHFSF